MPNAPRALARTSLSVRVRSASRARDRARWASASVRRVAELARRDGIHQLAIVVGAALVYELARRLVSPDWTAAEENARRIAQLEHALHLGVERQLQGVFLGAPWLLRLLGTFYL